MIEVAELRPLLSDAKTLLKSSSALSFATETRALVVFKSRLAFRSLPSTAALNRSRVSLAFVVSSFKFTETSALMALSPALSSLRNSVRSGLIRTEATPTIAIGSPLLGVQEPARDSVQVLFVTAGLRVATGRRNNLRGSKRLRGSDLGRGVRIEHKKVGQCQQQILVLSPRVQLRLSFPGSLEGAARRQPLNQVQKFIERPFLNRGLQTKSVDPLEIRGQWPLVIF